MNRTNEKHSYWGLDLQVCDLLQVLTEEVFKKWYEK